MPLATTVGRAGRRPQPAAAKALTVVNRIAPWRRAASADSIQGGGGVSRVDTHGMSPRPPRVKGR